MKLIDATSKLMMFKWFHLSIFVWKLIANMAAIEQVAPIVCPAITILSVSTRLKKGESSLYKNFKYLFVLVFLFPYGPKAPPMV